MKCESFVIIIPTLSNPTFWTGAGLAALDQMSTLQAGNALNRESLSLMLPVGLAIPEAMRSLCHCSHTAGACLALIQIVVFCEQSQPQSYSDFNIKKIAHERSM